MEFLLTEQQQTHMHRCPEETLMFFNYCDEQYILINNSFYLSLLALRAKCLFLSFFFFNTRFLTKIHISFLTWAISTKMEFCNLPHNVNIQQLQTLTTERCCCWPVGHIYICPINWLARAHWCTGNTLWMPQ